MTRRLVNIFTIFAACFLAFLLAGSIEIHAASINSGTCLVNASGGAYLRAATSTSSGKICLLNDNTKLTISKVIFKSKTSTSAKQIWYKASTDNGKSGYIRGDLIDNKKFSPVNANVTAKVNYRSGAGTKMKLKGSFKKNATVSVCLKAQPVTSTKGSSSTWYMVKVGTKYYYACSSSFKIVSEPTPVENTTAETDKITVRSASGLVDSSDGAVIRKSASADSATVCVVEDNAALTINKVVFVSRTSTKAKYKWYYVSVNGKKGYIRSDLVDSVKYQTVKSTVTANVNYRCGAGTEMTLKGSLKKGNAATICLTAVPVEDTKGSSATWYMIACDGNFYYASSTSFKLTANGETITGGSENKPADPEPEAQTESKLSKMSDAEFEEYLLDQGFDSSYIKPLKALHKSHPNWDFKAKITDVVWSTAVTAETKGTVSQIQRAGSSAWVTANKTEVSYYMDPRNFLKDERVFMFEDLNYHSEYQTEAVVDKILKGTYLETYGFKSAWFVKYGAMYDVSPVHLASRARQETGGGSAAINGHGEWNDTVVYNPFNIGANTGVYDGIKRAYEKGWFTKEASVKGGAEFIGSGYINAGQNTIYSERFNVVNGKANHQYMSNTKAPYSEAYSTYNSYKSNGILDEGFVFIVPVYKSMPSSTSL